MSLLDFVTGGKNEDAEAALKRAQQEYENIQAPTTAELTLPDLQKYVSAGILTPEQAKTMLVQGNAYNDIKTDPSTRENETDALNKLKGLTETGGMDDAMKAQLTAALDQVATADRGTNASISDQFAQKGIPSSLMAEAAMREESGNNARNANLTATQAAGQAETNAINAMMNEGNLASTIHGQDYNEQAQKAQAENAIRQWNAGAGNTTNEANAGRAERADTANLTNAQNISNENTGLTNTRTAYNANVPETVFNNKMQRAAGISGVAGQQANQATQAGQQNAGLMAGLIGAGATVAGGPIAGMAASKAASPGQMTQSGTEDQLPGGGYAEGGPVPGNPIVPGDSPLNDKVHAMLSPGEVVVPRSIVPHPDAVKRFVQNLAYSKPPAQAAHPDDVHNVLQALTKMRTGEIKDIPQGDSFMTVKKGEQKPPSLFDFPHPNSKVIRGPTTIGANRG